jgi:hypothetical protein
MQFEMDTVQEYEIDLVTPLEYDSRTVRKSMANPPKRDWTGIFAGCVFVGGLLWVAHLEISKVDERIASVDKHIGHVETAVRIVGAKQGGDTKTLIDEALAVAKNAADAGRTESAKNILNIANGLLAEQKASLEQAPQEFFDSAIQSYQKLRKSPALADSVWEGTTKLAEYRSAITSVPPGFSSVYIGEMGKKGPFRYLKDSLVSGQNAIKTPGCQGFDLDGWYLDNVVFQNVTICYRGGLAVLNNVRFVNCQFDIVRSPKADQLIEAVVKQRANLALG